MKIPYFITEQLAIQLALAFFIIAQIMSEAQSQSIPSFLAKLQEILQNTLFAHIIRWDKSGDCIHIVCVHALEEVVLPQYFRHARYSSFVRQLNMYGFNKRKAQKNVGAAFHNPHFSKKAINLAAMAKRGKKQNKQEGGKNGDSNSSKQSQILHHEPESSTQAYQNSVKNSALIKQIPISQPTQEQAYSYHRMPEICQLIAELAERVEPLLHDQITWLNSRELELLIRQPKFQKVSCAVLGLLDYEELSPFAEIHVNTIGSDRMEFIL